MADFNLSAEIALNLAKGAAASLRKQIQDGFVAPLEVDVSKAEKEVKKAKKKAADSPIVVPVIFENKDAKGQYAEIKKQLDKHPIPLLVEFSKSSVKNDLSSTALKKLMGERRPKIDVDVVFSKRTATELRKVEKQIKTLLKYKEGLQEAIDKDTAGRGEPAKPSFTPSHAPITGNRGDLSEVELKKLEKTAGKTSDSIEGLRKRVAEIDWENLNTGAVFAAEGIEELFKRFISLSKLSNKFGESNAYGGGFFKSSLAQIRELAAEYDKLGAEPGTGISLLKEKFAGIHDKGGADNLLGSLRVLFKSLSELETLSNRLNAAELIAPGRVSTALRDEIESTRVAFLKLFSGPDSADPQSFAVSINQAFDSVKKNTGSTIQSLSRDVRLYDSLLTQLAQKLAYAKAGGRGKESLSALGALQSRVTDLRSQRQSVEQIKADPEVIKLSTLTGALQFVDISADRATTSIEILLNKVNRLSNELKNTRGGQLVGLEGIAKSAGAKGSAQIVSARAKAGTSSSSEINREVELAKSEVNQTIGDAVKRAEKVNGLLGRINNQLATFEANGFNNAATALESFIPLLDTLVQKGEPLEKLDKLVTEKLAQSLSLKGLDAKINTAVKQIERLRNSLDFSSVSDVSGAKKQLDDLQNSLATKSGKFAGLTQESLDKNVSAGLFDVRSAQKFNEAIATTATKLRAVGEANENLAVGKIYSDKADEFERGAARIAAGTDSLSSKFIKLKALSTSTFVGAKFDAEGGFLGSVAKSAGLAAKRLGAFLILAQGLYKVQSLFSEAFQDALKIDREFIKLEQVLNKDFSGASLKKNLSDLKNQIFDLGKTLGVSTLEVANSAQILAQAGIQGRDLQVLLGTVAQSQLGPSFGSATETAEAAIAVFRQFNLTANETRDAIGGINRLSAKYAVEAKGITEGVRRAGGVFATSGAGIAEFAASFTLIKQQTREADESIATALRNVAQRLQSSNVQKYLKEALGLDLVENGEFIGFERSISRIGQKLQELGVTQSSPLFSEVREKIAGRLQAGRITPLLQDYDQYAKLVKDFADGSKSIQEDTLVAFDAIENKIQRAKSALQQLFTEIIQSDFVKFVVEGFVQITTFASNLLRTLNSLPGAFLAIGAAAKLLANSKFVAQAALSQIIPRTTILGKNKGGPIGFNDGGSGHIPGRGPNKDSLLAYLTKGEYVIQREAVDQYGVGFFDKLNSGAIQANNGGIIARNNGGVIPGFAKGGIVGYNEGGLTEKLLQAGFDLTKEMVNKFVKKFTIENLPNKAKGLASVKNQSIRLSNGNDLNVLAHEFGHIITAQLDKSQLKEILKELPDSIKTATYERIKRRQDAYGTEGTSRFKRSYEREVLADAIQAIAQKSRGENSSHINNSGLNLLEEAIKQKTGIKFKPVPTNHLSPYVINPSTALNPVGKTYVGKSSYAGSIIENAEKKSVKSTNYSEINKSNGLGFLNKKISLPTKELAGFGKSLVSTKAGLISLAGAAILSHGVLAQFNTGISELIIAVGSAAATFYAFSQLGSTVKNITSALGTDKVGKAKGIAAKFLEGKGGRGKVLIPNDLTPDKVLANSLSNSAIARQTAIKGGTAGILANIRGTSSDRAAAKAAQLAAGGGVKSAGAASAIAAANSTNKLTQVMQAAATRFPKLASAGSLLSANLGFAAIAVGAVSGALGYFLDQAKKSGQEELEAAEDMKQVSAAGSKIRLADALKEPLKNVAGFITKALGGASIGLAVAGPIGAIIGAVVGGLFQFSGYIKKALDAIGLGIVSDAFSGVSKSVSDFFGKIGDSLYALTEGMDALVNAKLEEAKDFRLRQASNKLSTNKREKKPYEEVSLETIGDILASVKSASGIIKEVGKGDFKALTDEQQAAIKEDLQGVAGLFNQLSSADQDAIIDVAKRSGENFEALFQQIEIDINNVEQKANISFNALSLFFAGMAQQVDLAAARLDGLSGGIQLLGDTKKPRYAPDQLFDILGAGFNPDDFNLGPKIAEAFQNSLNLANQFDPRLVESARFDISGRRASRLAQQSVIANPGLKIKPDDLNSFITESFRLASGEEINSNLNEKFQVFIDSKAKDLDELLDNAGVLDGTKLNALFKEFSDGLDSGALEQIKRLNSLSNEFTSKYKDLISERFALENEALGYLRDNVDKQKSLFDLQNRAKGLKGDALAAAEGRQAAEIDERRARNTLTGTGVGAGASPQVLTAAILASQNRAQNASLIAKQEQRAGLIGGGAAGLDARIAEIEAIETERQNRLKAQLQYQANGTEVATNAMKEFERAATKAAASSKFLSDALLGSDEQMKQTVLGLQAFAAVQQAYQTGGVGAAQAELRRFGEDARQALNSTIGGNEEKQGLFEKFVGIGNNVQAGPEFAAAQAGIKQGEEANKGLAAITNNLTGSLNQNITDLKTFYASQFQNAQNIVAQAEATAKNLVGQIAALPSVISHEGNITVNLVGAGALNILQDGIKDFVQTQINTALKNHTDKLVDANQGLNKPEVINQNNAVSLPNGNISIGPSRRIQP